MPDQDLKINYDPNDVLGAIPVVSAGNMMLASSHAISRMFEATVSQQQLNDQIAMASATQCTTRIINDNSADRDSMFIELVKLMNR